MQKILDKNFQFRIIHCVREWKLFEKVIKAENYDDKKIERQVKLA